MALIILRLSSFGGIGSSGHWYGTLQPYHDHDRKTEIELFYTITEEHREKMLKAKTSVYGSRKNAEEEEYYYQIGETSQRFWSKNEVFEAAIAEFNATFDPENDLLVCRNPVYMWDSKEDEILSGNPQAIADIANLRTNAEIDAYMRKL